MSTGMWRRLRLAVLLLVVVCLWLLVYLPVFVAARVVATARLAWAEGQRLGQEQAGAATVGEGA